MKNKAFTLIELLVVIAIIGFLATVVMVNLNSARARARDAVRIQSLHQLIVPLHLYYDDFEHYPTAGGSSFAGFSYKTKDANGNCFGPGPPSGWRFDNVGSGVGIIENLHAEGYAPGFNDPIGTDTWNTVHNCRYVIGFFTDPSEIQRLYIHCYLEEPNAASINDGGFGDYQEHYYEISLPEPWACIDSQPST